MSMIQFVAVEFKPGGRRYTYQTTDLGLDLGDRVKVPAFRGDGWSAVTVVELDVPEPTAFVAKAILGRVEDAPDPEAVARGDDSDLFKGAH